MSSEAIEKPEDAEAQAEEPTAAPEEPAQAPPPAPEPETPPPPAITVTEPSPVPSAEAEDQPAEAATTSPKQSATDLKQPSSLLQTQGSEPFPEIKPSSPAMDRSMPEIKTHSLTEVKTSKPEPEPDQKSVKSVTDQRFSVQEITKSKQSFESIGKRHSKDDSKDLFVRRKSTRSIKNAVGSIVSFRRGSIAEYFDRQKTAKFMNTYKLDSENPFNVDRVTKILEEVLVEALENLTYDTDRVPKQAKWASSAIRAKVKEQEFDRYKIICIVTIGEKRSQDVFSTYRFLWDMDRDKHASFVHENMYVFAVAVCFGLYYE